MDTLWFRYNLEERSVHSTTFCSLLIDH